MGRRKMKRRRVNIAVMALCGAPAAAECEVEARSRDVRGFGEIGFIQNFRLASATLDHNVGFCLEFSANNYEKRRSRGPGPTRVACLYKLRSRFKEM